MTKIFESYEGQKLKQGKEIFTITEATEKYIVVENSKGIRFKRDIYNIRKRIKSGTIILGENK